MRAMVGRIHVPMPSLPAMPNITTPSGTGGTENEDQYQRYVGFPYMQDKNTGQWVKDDTQYTLMPDNFAIPYSSRPVVEKDMSKYKYPDEVGYVPPAGVQGVVTDLTQGINWTAPPRDVFASIADKKRPCERSRHNWNRESVRFPVETARYARENDNMGVRNFRYGDPPPPGPPSGLREIGCIGAAAVAAAAVTGSVVPVMG